MSSAPLQDLPAERRPFLLPKGPVPQPGRSMLQWWHLLSLDAPTVAATWTLFVAQCAGVRMAWTDPIAMFLAVWMLYATDRLLDARSLRGGEAATGLEERHRFHHTHRTRFLATLVAMCLPLTYLLRSTDAAVLSLYVALFSLLSAWLLLVHARPASSTATADRLPKEVAVGLFFPAAIFIPTIARVPALRLPLLPAALSFACVCTLNCLFLFAWEHQQQRGHAHFSTRWGVRHLILLSAAVIVLTAALALHAALGPAGPLNHAEAIPLACFVSTSVLLCLHQLRHRFRRTTLRALADLALMTPPPIWLGLRLLHLRG